MGVARRKRKEPQERKLSLELEVFVDAYQFLQSSRYPNMGEYLLPIPAHAILTYCKAYEWEDSDEFYIMVEVLRSLDRAYLESVNSKKKGKGIGNSHSRGRLQT